MAHPDNDRLGFVEGCNSEAVSRGDERDSITITVNVPLELVRKVFLKSVIILTVEEWDAMLEARKEPK